MDVMKHEHQICEENSMASSANLGDMKVSKNTLEGIILEAKMKALSNSKIFDEFHSKLFYFSCSLEKNTPKFRIMIFHSRINPCVEMLK